MFEIVILSIIQGATEFLPISSSSHLIIVSEYLKFENQNLSIDVSLHIGSFFAVLTYFYKDIFNFVKNKELLIKIITSSLPVMIVGFLLIKTNLIYDLRNIKIIGWTTLIFGILLYFSDKFSNEKNITNNFSYKSAIFIGLLQIFSLVPGVSRSGITITAARFLKFSRYDSSKISFLLSIPTLGAVSFHGISSMIKSNNLIFTTFNLSAVICSFIFSYITIKFFLKYIKKASLTIFVIYRIILAFILLGFAYL